MQDNANAPMFYSAQALTEVTACAFPMEKLHELLKSRKELKLPIDLYEST